MVFMLTFIWMIQWKYRHNICFPNVTQVESRCLCNICIKIHKTYADVYHEIVQLQDDLKLLIYGYILL